MIIILTQNEVNEIPRDRKEYTDTEGVLIPAVSSQYEWQPIQRTNNGHQMIWVEDGTDLSSLIHEVVLNEDGTPQTLEQSGHSELVKEKRLAEMKVTVTSGVRFYADPTSAMDISDAIEIATDSGLPDTTITNWKTPDGFMNVTLADLKEARKLRLNKKAEIIGA